MMVSPRPAFWVCLLFLSLAASRAFSAETAVTLSAAGAAAEAVGNYHQAIEKYKEALALNPSFSTPMAGLADCFFLLEEYDEALRWVTRALFFQAGDPDLMVLQGRIRIGLGELAEARGIFSQVLARQPNNLEARFGTAEAEVAAGRPRNAISLYSDALRLAPESAKALLSLAVLSDETGDAPAADRYFDLALRAHSDDPQVQLAAGAHLLRAGDYVGAEKRARIALSLAEGLEPATMLLGEVLLQRKRYGEAADVFRDVVGANRDSFLGWYGLGMSYALAGDASRALSSFATGLSVRPEDELARVAMEAAAIDSLKMDDPQRAKLAGYHLDLGSQLEARDFQEKALAEYRRALLIDPTSRDARVAYGKVFQAMGFPARYLSELQVLAKLGVKDAFVSDEIEALGSDLEGSLSRSWGVDQFAVERRKYSVPVFTLPARNRLLHPQADALAARYFTDMLTRVETLTVPAIPQVVPSFEDAFRAAREQGSDYFVVLSADETERTFSAAADLFLSRTGSRISGFRATRTGNDRVRDSFLKIVSDAAPVFAPRGTLLVRRFDEGLIDIGSFQGLKKGDALVIVRRGKVQENPEGPGVLYDQGDVLADFTVGAVDEGVASGVVARRGFFDYVNPGDEVVIPVKKVEAAPPAAPPRGGNVLTRLFGIGR